MKPAKRISAAVLAVATLTTVASADWKFAGYDTTNPPAYGKIYNEVIGGNYTSKQKVDAVKDEDVEWKFEGYELSYPHIGYERLYLEGNAQKAVTRLTNQFPQWEVRFADFMWEVSGEHRIYQRQQTKINNKYWAWDFGRDKDEDKMVFVPTTRNAKVSVDFKDYGIANLDCNGKFVYDTNGNVYNDEKYTLYSDFVMPSPFNVEKDENGDITKQIASGDFFHSDNLSAIDADGHYAVSDWDIAQRLDIVQSKFVTGPSYYGESGTKDAAAMYYRNKDYGWQWDDDTIKITHEPKIEWTKPMYEMDEPYCYYQYLIVNGIAMDGHNDTPRIFRYTGGKATPEVQWKYAFVEADYPYNIVEYKYIRGNDGKMVQAFDASGCPVYRYPTGEHGNTYFKVTDTEVQCWIRDKKGDYMIDAISRTDADFGDWYAGYVNAAGYVNN